MHIHIAVKKTNVISIYNLYLRERHVYFFGARNLLRRVLERLQPPI